VKKVKELFFTLLCMKECKESERKKRNHLAGMEFVAKRKEDCKKEIYILFHIETTVKAKVFFYFFTFQLQRENERVKKT
jgi:hypothetical protein